MSGYSPSAPSREALQRLRDLRLFDGDPPAFWTRFTEIAVEVTRARQGRTLVELNGQWNRLAAAPEDGTQARFFITGGVAEEAAAVFADPESIHTVPTQPGYHSLLFPLTLEAGYRQKCLLELVFEGEAGATPAPTALLELLADTPRLYQHNRAAAQRGEETERLARALDILAAVNEHKKFSPAAMTLVNELVTRFGAERVTLGWVHGYYVKISTISGTEQFQRKMQVLQQLEAAMEECRDQDEEILFPAPEGAEAIIKDHHQYSTDSSSPALLSAPVRVEGEVVAVITLERLQGHFTESDARAVRVIADQVAPRLKDLQARDRWFGARWAAASRGFLAKFLSPRHTWLKLGAILGTALFLFALIVPLPYSVDATFQVRADTMAFVSAPFEGYLSEARVRPGDIVTAGQVVLTFEEQDLRIEEAEALAEIQRYQAEAELAEAERNLSDLRVSRALRQQAEARLALARHRLERAVLRAPFDGVVVQGDFRDRVGARINQGDQLLLISELQGLYADIRLPERDIDLIDDSGKARLVFASRPDLEFAAAVEVISPAAYPDEEGTAFSLRARVVDDADWLRPGMTGVARVNSEDRTLLWRATHRIIDFIRLKLWI
jgi:RND family efflux transporter MFP subunit